MAQSNIITREQAIYVGEETTFGVTPSGSFPNAMTRCFVLDELHGDGAMREMLDVSDVRTRRAEAIQPVQALEIASKFALKQYLKATPAASQLVSGQTGAALTPRILLRQAFGYEHADEGSTVATGTSGTQFDVQAGEGIRFAKGTYIAVAISGQMEWAKITNIATDTITVSPALSGTPATSAVVRNLYSYAIAESQTNSLTAQVAYVGDTAAQYTFNGGHGDVSFAWEIGKLPTIALDVTAVSFTTGALGLSTAVASDEMGATASFQPSVYLAAASTVTRASPLVCEGFNVEMKNNWEMVRDPSATQTVSAVVNTAGRPRAASAKVKVRFDPSYPTAYDAETRYNFCIAWRIGTGANASFWIFQMDNAYLVAEPKLTNVGNRLYMDLELNGLQSDTVTLGGTTGDALNPVYSNLSVAFG
jgi:hypothetical protein